MISKLQNGLLKCFYFSMVYKKVFLFPLTARHGLQARNSLQATNDMQKHFAKPREIAKMPIEPHNHASKEESPLTEITHEVSHSISYLLKPSKLIAPAESSS